MRLVKDTGKVRGFYSEKKGYVFEDYAGNVSVTVRHDGNVAVKTTQEGASWDFWGTVVFPEIRFGLKYVNEARVSGIMGACGSAKPERGTLFLLSNGTAAFCLGKSWRGDELVLLGAHPTSVAYEGNGSLILYIDAWCVEAIGFDSVMQRDVRVVDVIRYWFEDGMNAVVYNWNGSRRVFSLPDPKAGKVGTA